MAESSSSSSSTSSSSNSSGSSSSSSSSCSSCAPCDLTGITPETSTVCVGTTATFTAVGTGDLTQVQWKVLGVTGVGETFTTKFSLGGSIKVEAKCGEVTKQATVNVVAASVNSGTNRKLLIYGKRYVSAAGSLKEPSPTFEWIPPATGGAFDPMSGAPNDGQQSFRTLYIAPVVGTPSDQKDKEHVAVKYAANGQPDGGCTFKALLPINITEPARPVIAKVTNAGKNGRVVGNKIMITESDIDLPGADLTDVYIIQATVEYTIKDQFTDIISNSDMGTGYGIGGKSGLIFVNKELVPFKSDIRGLDDDWQQVRTRKVFTKTDLNRGKFADTLQIYVNKRDLEPLIADIQNDVRLVYVEAHEWFIGIADPSTPTDPFMSIKITQNKFAAKVKRRRPIRGGIRFDIETEYEFDLPED